MEEVYLLQHLHIHDDGDEDVKIIGIYSSYDKALEAVARLKTKPGFIDFPLVRDADIDEEGNENGFYIERYQLNEDNWAEGYTMSWE